MPHIVHRQDITPEITNTAGWQRLNLVAPEVAADLDAGLELHILASGVKTARHYHQNCEHYIFIVSGQGKLCLDDGHHDIGQGYLIAIDPDERHALENDGRESLEYLEFFVPHRAAVTIVEEAA